MHGIVLAEIEEYMYFDGTSSIFKLADRYCRSQANTQGRFVFLILNDGVGEALKQTPSQKRENKSIIIIIAIKIVRPDITGIKNSFSGT